MARDIATITASIDAALTANLAALGITLSASQVAAWKLWRDTAANMDLDFEVVMDLFQADIQAYIDSKQIGSLSWYAAHMLAFQYGDNLQVNADGTLGYAAIDTSKQIIKLCSVKEVDVSDIITLVVKLAKLDGGGVTVPLSGDELLGATDYLNSIKIVGTKTLPVSQNADVILYDCDVVYNAEFAQSNVNTGILAALDAFRQSPGFDPTFYASTFESVIKNVPGVVAVRINTLTGTPYGGSPAAITLGYELQAGYFNFDGASTLTYTAA